MIATEQSFNLADLTWPGAIAVVAVCLLIGFMYYLIMRSIS